MRAGLIAVLLLAMPAAAQDRDEICNQGTCESTWLILSDAEKDRVTDFSGDYKAFMDVARTELSTVTQAVQMARAAGFRPFEPDMQLTPGDRLYSVNRDRSVAFFIVGRDSLANGARIAASHIDSPRLELKARPVYERQEFGLFQTNYHGGLKTYQWSNIPLALVGRVDKPDGRTINVSIGLDPDDPVFIIPDLSPHVDGMLRERSQREVLTLEELDPIAAHIHGTEMSVSDMLYAALEDRYGIEAQDLVSAELSLVPAFAPRDVGLDRGLMAIYGQDDKISAFASLRGLLDMEGMPPETAIVYLADNEESGNNNNTGAESTFLADLMSELLFSEMGDGYREPFLRRMLSRSLVLSLDLNPGVNPLWPAAWELGNAPRLGYGVNIKAYGRGNNANSEFTAWIRGLLDNGDIPWQTTTYKVGRAGGGTLGGALSAYNMEVIDIGVPVLSIHTPYAVSSKVDVYWLYRTSAEFFAADRGRFAQ